jgi:transcriptional regulator with XRE-family HTH domain
MKINAGLVVELRTKKSWSQEELAIAAGVNLRTIQRIEGEARVSLQSKKALASVFGVPISDLTPQETTHMKKYEFKMLEIQSKEGFLSGIKKQELPDFTSILNKEGQEGWLLVQILSPELSHGVWSGKTGNLLAILQREVIE